MPGPELRHFVGSEHGHRKRLTDGTAIFFVTTDASSQVIELIVRPTENMSGDVGRQNFSGGLAKTDSVSLALAPPP